MEKGGTIEIDCILYHCQANDDCFDLVELSAAKCNAPDPNCSDPRDEVVVGDFNSNTCCNDFTCKCVFYEDADGKMMKPGTQFTKDDDPCNTYIARVSKFIYFPIIGKNDGKIT